MENIYIILILAVILAGAIWYILRSKKSGKKCIGCPHSGNCSSCQMCSVPSDEI